MGLQVLLQLLRILCTRDLLTHRHGRRRQLLIILLSDGHRRRNTKDHTSHAIIKAQLYRLQELHIMELQMDEDTGQLRPTPNAHHRRKTVETLRALHIQIPYPLDRVVNRMVLIPLRKLLTRERRFIQIACLTGGITFLALTQLGSHCMRGTSMTTDITLRTLTQRGRDKSVMQPYRGTVSSAIELIMSMAIACNNRNMRTK
jgi:hypothetical protein